MYCMFAKAIEYVCSDVQWDAGEAAGYSLVAMGGFDYRTNASGHKTQSLQLTCRYRDLGAPAITCSDGMQK